MKDVCVSVQWHIGITYTGIQSNFFLGRVTICMCLKYISKISYTNIKQGNNDNTEKCTNMYT